MGKTTKERDKWECPSCGRDISMNNYYESSSPLYKALGHIPICKNCIVEIFDNYVEKNNKDTKLATYLTCRKLDIFYSESDYEGALGEAKRRKRHIFRTYITKINSLGGVNNGGLSFDESEHILVNQKEEKKEKKKDTNKENKVDIDFDEFSKNIKFTEKDNKTKDDVVRLMGYDPFAGYSKFDQKFLYGELLPYLDEDTLEDQYKLSQIIQLLNNNNQIRKIDLLINKITSNANSLLKNTGDFNSLANIKNKIVGSSDKIAKENSISVKHRGDKKSGRSTLGYLMKQYRELGFEQAEQDYYDQMKALGMKRVADISNQSIIEQLQFDENDIDDMFKQQRDMIAELQEEKMDLEEAIRKLNEDILKLKGGEVSLNE